MIEITGVSVWHVLFCAACHFGLGLLVGSLAYYWISTTLSPTTSSYLRLDGITNRYLDAFSTFQLLLLVSLCCALLAHVLEDYVVRVF